MIGLDDIDRLTGGRIGRHDTICPLCSPFRSTPKSQRLRVLRIWRVDDSFAGYHCIHCGGKGHARDSISSKPDPVRFAEARAEAVERAHIHRMERLHKALNLWSKSRPIEGTIAETYLRNRGYGGPVPDTVRFLRASGDYAPAMIAIFGIPHEIEPGVIRIATDAIKGVHLARLLPDGSDRERGDHAKIMIGQSMGSPIVLAPPNDLLGIAITEGIEDGLSVHAATGLGVMAAGSAGRMPALATAIPDFIDCVTIYAHADDAGQRHGVELADVLTKRGLEVLIEGVL